MEETGFNYLFLPVPEVGQKMPDGLLLVVGKIVKTVLDSLEVLHILQQGIGPDQIFVYIVEVG